jgi:hypothetical protein
MIKPIDDSFHEKTDDPDWNESAWFSFMVPERKLSGFVYFYHRTNMGYSIGGIGLWDPSGEETYNCLYQDWGDVHPTPEGADMFNFDLRSGLSVRMIEPLRSFQLNYKATTWYGGQGCTLDLRFDGFIEPTDSGFPPGQDEWAHGPGSGHYEQAGRMRGTVMLNGERIDIDCYSLRDRSWGPRRLTTNPRCHFPWAIGSERSGFNFMAVSDLDPADDPGIGTTERIITGWYLKDGEVAHLSSGQYRVVERGVDGRPLRLQVDATDDLGRVLHAEGRTHNNFNWHTYPWLWMWWNQVEWQLDGETAWGEEQDYWPLQQGRRFIRSMPDAPKAAHPVPALAR